MFQVCGLHRAHASDASRSLARYWVVPFYYKLKSENAADRRTAKNLLALQDLFREGDGEKEIEGEMTPDFINKVPVRTHRKTLNLATWNIREFDSSKYGKRTKESLHYIAEIISHFDLVAVQEIREDLSALNEVMWILGDQDWKYLVTDVTEGAAGNSERMAFIYDTRKVKPTGLVGEVVLPPKKNQPVRQFARSPFLVGFQAGWFKFSLCTVHIYYGSSTAEDPQRVQEIDELAGFLAKRAKKYRERYHAHEYCNIGLLGDFNIFEITDKTYAALLKHGFVVPQECVGLRTNIGRQRRSFDQIAFLEHDKDVRPGAAGVFNFYKTVYRPEDQGTYRHAMARTIKDSNANKPQSKRSDEYDARSDKRKKSYYNSWKTFQMSDHLPLWVELSIDFSHEYLERKTKKPKKKAK